MRLRVSTNVLDLIPSDTPGVAELKRLNSHLADERMLLVLIETTEPDGWVDEEAIAKLADRLREVAGTAAVLSPQDGVDASDGFAEVLAYLWLNGDPKAFQAQLAKATGPEMTVALERAKRTLAGSMDEFAVARAGYDPLGFARLPLVDWSEASVRTLMAGDGAASLLRIEADRGLSGYKDYGAWISRIREAIDGQLQASAEPWQVSITGSPAFAAEIGGAMEQDMTGTTSVAGFLIVALFLFLQRSIRQLVAIAVCLALTLLLTLAAFGWVIGDLGVVSGGFAAILMGLTVDYAMILSREVHAGGGLPTEGRRRAQKGIVWGALTTAAPFAVLMTSSMPGGKQLGFLVMSGLLIGASVMLGVFPVLAFGRAGNATRARTPRLGSLSPGRARWTGALLALVALALAAWLGRNARLSFDLETLRPEGSPAMEALERAQKRFPAWDAGTVHVWTEEGRRVDWTQLNERVDRLLEEGILSSAFLPEGLLPDEDRFQANARTLVESPTNLSGSLRAGFDEAGFTENASALAETVIQRAQAMAESSAAKAFERAVAHPLLGNHVLPGDDLPKGAVGAVRLAVDLDPTVHAKLSALNETGVSLTSWPMLGPTIEPMLAADITATLIPMFVALAIALLVALRSLREAGLAVGLLVLGLLWVFVVMGLRSGSHEFLFLDVIGLVMLMGVGLDYTLHLTFALRREKGDVPSVLRSTGTAIAFCAVSTAIGFGSLTLASNRALAGLGWLAGGGILLLALLILGLLPGLWLGRRTK